MPWDQIITTAETPALRFLSLSQDHVSLPCSIAKAWRTDERAFENKHLEF